MRFISRCALVALVAVFVMSAVVATSAEAAEGPFYKASGARLKAGESSELKASVSKAYVMTWGTFKFACTAQKLAAGAKIIGSSGASAGTGEETIVFEGCTVEGNGSGCELENKKITTTAIGSELAYGAKERAGKVLSLFKPVSGSVFATLKFVGTCAINTMVLEGSVTAEAWSGAKAVEVGKEPAEAVANEVKFPETSIKKVWIEKARRLEEKKPVLQGFGKVLTIVGGSELTLAGEPRWSVFTR
jgi:hypothetical protein